MPAPAVISSTAIIPVGQPHTEKLLTGSTITTVTFPAASSGSGTLTLTGSTVLPGFDTGDFGDTVLAAISITPSESATYATFPTFSFKLPAGTNIENQIFEVELADQSSDFSLQGIGRYVASVNNGGVSLSPAPGPQFSIGFVGAPILPITISPTNSVGYELIEMPAQAISVGAKRDSK